MEFKTQNFTMTEVFSDKPLVKAKPGQLSGDLRGAGPGQ